MCMRAVAASSQLPHCTAPLCRAAPAAVKPNYVRLLPLFTHLPQCAGAQAVRQPGRQHQDRNQQPQQIQRRLRWSRSQSRTRPKLNPTNEFGIVCRALVVSRCLCLSVSLSFWVCSLSTLFLGFPFCAAFCSVGAVQIICF